MVALERYYFVIIHSTVDAILPSIWLTPIWSPESKLGQFCVHSIFKVFIAYLRHSGVTPSYPGALPAFNFLIYVQTFAELKGTVVVGVAYRLLCDFQYLQPS